MSLVLPKIIMVGDSVKAEWSLPLLDGNETWASGRLLLRLMDENDDIKAGYDATLAGSMATIELAAADTEALLDGIWRYQMRATGSAGSVMTLEASMVDIQDPLNPRLSVNQRALNILQATYETKLTGRGDVRDYIIGDRETRTMTLDELDKAIDKYTEKVSFERNKRKYWAAYGPRTR